MYFASRLQAGRMLAARLTPRYRYENCAVMALNDGGVMVGAQIAAQLHCVLTLLQSSEIMLPRETQALAAITADGAVSYNRHHYSEGQIKEINWEQRNLIEQEKLRQMRDLNRLVGSTGTISKGLLKGQNVIVVSDGLKTGFEFDLAVEFLKPIAI